MKFIIPAVAAFALLGASSAKPLHAGRGLALKHEAIHNARRSLEAVGFQQEKRALVTEIICQTVTAPDVVIIVDEDGTPITTSWTNQGATAVRVAQDMAQATPVPVEAFAVTKEIIPSSTTGPISDESAFKPQDLPASAPEVTAAPAVVSIPQPPVEASKVEPIVQSPAEPPKSQPEPAPAPQPPAEPPKSEPAPAPQPPAEAPKPEPVPQPAPIENSPQPPVSSGDFPIGLAYTPYTTGPCKGTDQIVSDFKRFEGFGVVRIYGTDCSQVANAVAAAKVTNKQLIVGIFNIDNVASEVQTIVDQSDDFASIAAIIVGNEEVNQGKHTVDAVVNAVNAARTQLRAAGYSGPVSTADTFNQVIANKALCDASDITTINCHAFFTNSVSADQAGKYVADQVEEVRRICGSNKTVVVTESGWPSAGQSNGKAIPSRENQQAAIASLKDHFPNGNLVIHSAFDDAWKQNFAGTFGAEQHWGIMQ